MPWVEAIEAARRAESLLGSGEAGDVSSTRVRAFLADVIRERDAVEAAEKDRRIVERLAAILNDFGVHNDERKADAEYAAAFHAYGVDLDAPDPAAAGRAIAASPAAADLASALDQWAFLRRGAGPARPGRRGEARRDGEGRRPGPVEESAAGHARPPRERPGPQA